jgi:hypothetical protein
MERQYEYGALSSKQFSHPERSRFSGEAKDLGLHKFLGSLIASPIGSVIKSAEKRRIKS